MALGDFGFTMTPLLGMGGSGSSGMGMGMGGGIPPELQKILDQMAMPKQTPYTPMGLQEEIDVTGDFIPSTLGAGSPMSAGMTTLPMDPMELPQGPGIPSMPALAHPTMLDKWAASDRLPTFGMGELDHQSRKDAIRAGLMSAGMNLMGSIGPGNQNFGGNLGQALQAGFGDYKGALSGADAARRADDTAAMQKEKFDWEMGQARKEVLDEQADLEARNQERQRIIGDLDDTQKKLMDPFIKADDDTWYNRLEAITTDEQKDRIIRNIGDQPYEFGREPGSPATKIPGVDYSKDPTGQDGMKLSQISSEARALAKAQLDAEIAAQERAREWADFDIKFPETIPANRMDQLYEEKLEMLKGMYGGGAAEISRGGGRPTAEGDRPTATGAGDINADIDSIGLPADTAEEFKAIAANLAAQGVPPDEIRAQIQEALQSGG